MADTDASVAAGCLEKLKGYVKTRKGTILAAEIVRLFPFTLKASHKE